MTECLPDLPRYVRQHDNEWQGADHPDGPWRPIPAPQAGLPWLTDGPAVPESRELASVAANPTPLSPAAQAVLAAQAKQRCLFEWRYVNDPPCHPSRPGWNGCVQCIDRLGVAATLRASAEQMPSDYPASMEQMPEDARRCYRLGFGAASNCDRSWLSAIAAELKGSNG